MIADAIGLLILGLQYFSIIALADACFGAGLPRDTMTGLFAAFAILAIVVWRSKKNADNAAEWGKFALISIFLGLGFFGVDWMIAYFNGEPRPSFAVGTPLGLILTVAVCPCATMVCVAGLIRAVYTNRARGAGRRGVT